MVYVLNKNKYNYNAILHIKNNFKIISINIERLKMYN